MELKEAILSTLAEMQEDAPSSVIKAEEVGELEESPQNNRRIEPPTAQLHNLSGVDLDANEVLESMIKKEPPLMPMAQESVNLHNESPHAPARSPEESLDSDRRFLEGLRERILVMFEGMQSPNNRAAEAKIDLILNFFEWQLSLIDERLENKK